MKRLKKLYIAILFISPHFSEAQDIHFSHWLESPLISTPQTTGNFTGHIRAIGNFRNQWNSVTTPYKTSAISIEGQEIIPKLPGLISAVSIARDIAGDSRWQTTQTRVLMAYKILPSRGISIVPLIMTGYAQQEYSDDQLQYDQQWNGSYYDPSLEGGEEYTATRNGMWQIIHGLSITKDDEFKMSTLGYSMQMNRIHRNFNGFGDGRANRISISGTHRRTYNDYISAEASMHLQIQKNHRSIQPGFRIYKTLETTGWHSARLIAGLSVRVSDALIPSVGIQYDQWLGGISYDINWSKLKVASSGRGSIEIYIGTILKKIPMVTPAKYCRPIY